MFDDSSFDYQFFYGIMAFADSLMDNSCAFSSRSMTPPLFGSGNRQFGKMVPNNRDHLEMQQQPPKQQFGRRRRQRKQENQHQNGMIFCRYCPNKMPAAHMAGKAVWTLFTYNFFVTNYPVANVIFMRQLECRLKKKAWTLRWRHFSMQQNGSHIAWLWLSGICMIKNGFRWCLWFESL